MIVRAQIKSNGAWITVMGQERIDQFWETLEGLIKYGMLGKWGFQRNNDGKEYIHTILSK